MPDSDREPAAPGQSTQDAVRALAPRYGRYAGVLALVLLALITVNTIVTKPNGIAGVPPGQRIAPFAVPLVMSSLVGQADVATRPNQGSAGRIPACSLRGPRILNVCELSEHNPLVLALFVNGGSCTGVLGEMQSLSGQFPGVSFAAVALGGDRTGLRRLVRRMALTFPVGLDSDGALAALYKVATCPQVTFARPGGVVESKALVDEPSLATLRSRVAELVAASGRPQ